MLFQALKYYDIIDRMRYHIPKMFPSEKINPDEHPRIILIAERFSDDLKRLSTLVKPEVELYEYVVLKTSDNKIGIYYHPVSLPEIEEIIPEEMTVEKLRNYITEEPLRNIFDKVINEIKSVDTEIKEYPTKSYVGFKYRGRQIGYVYPYRKSLDIGALVIDKEGVSSWESKRVEHDTVTYDDILEKIKSTYEKLKEKEGSQ